MMAGRFRQKGLALVGVLWAVTLLAIMAGSFSLTLQRDAGLLTTTQDRARAVALADAGVHYAMLMLVHTDPLKKWRDDGRVYGVELPGGRVKLRVFDEGGKIDINAAQRTTLIALFTPLVGGPDGAEVLADAIMDWRDGDDMPSLHGAEAKEYQAAGKGYVPQNRNFQVLEELQMVLGMTPALYSRLEPMLTIYSGQDGINPVVASREALLAIPGIDPMMVEQYLIARRTAPPNAPLPPLAMPPTSGIRQSSAKDMAYTVWAEASLSERQGAGLRVVMRRVPSRNGSPFTIAGWKALTAGHGG